MKSIALDLWKPYHAPIEVVQREAGARTLAFQITDGNVALDLSDKVVTFYATKPDDSIVFNTCTITTAASGKCTYLVTAQTCAVVGDLSCTLVITGDGYEARTQPFTVTVIASPDYTSAVESTDEFTALAALAGDIAQNTADITTAEGRLDDIEAVNDPIKSAIVDLIYPVGAIYISVVSTSPATLFGGTWKAFGAGKTLVGIDAADTDFDTAEETGGAKTHTHTLTAASAQIASASDGIRSNRISQSFTPNRIFSAVDATETAFTTSTSVSTALAGSTDAGSSLQPYIVTYMWKRTA